MKKIVKIISMYFIILMLLLSIAGCSSKSNDIAYERNPGNSYYDPEAIGMYDYAEAEEYVVDAEGNTIRVDGVVTGAANSGNADTMKEMAPQAAQKKIIRNASAFIESDDANHTYEKISDYAVQGGGYEFSVSNNKNGENTTIDLVLKIPAQNLDNFIENLKECGEIINLDISAEDITDRYTDTQIRLSTMKKSLEKYYGFLENSKTTAEMLDIQREINNLTSEIEALEGKLNLWNKQIQESTVKINIREKNDITRYNGTIKWNALKISDMGTLIKVGFVKVTSTILAVIQWIVIIMISCIPLLILVAVVLAIVFRKKIRGIFKKK